jgi:hypothetical protein
VGQKLSLDESPELANDIKSRSPQEIMLAATLWSAFVQTLAFLVMLFQNYHQQAPTQQQINEIFNQTTIVFNQTINNVIKPPPGHS